MLTLELDKEIGDSCADRCYEEVRIGSWGVRGRLMMHRREIADGAVVYYVYLPSRSAFRYNICFEGRRIVLFEYRSDDGRIHFSVRGTEVALLEARLRGLL